MKKQNYSTFTSYLSKTHKNVDLYRLYNPHFSSFCKSYTYDHDFYLTYFSRHMITERNILTIFSIYAHFSYGMTKKETIKDFILFLKNINSVVFWNHSPSVVAMLFIWIKSENKKKYHGLPFHESMTKY